MRDVAFSAGGWYFRAIPFTGLEASTHEPPKELRLSSDSRGYTLPMVSREPLMWGFQEI
jgi:hypothetical protein